MSGSGNATVSVTGLALLLRNWYFTVTVSGVIVSSSNSIETSAERVKTSPPTDSSAAVSFADAPHGARLASATIPKCQSFAMVQLAVTFGAAS